MSLVFGSVCSGIGAPEMAWTALGWRCAFMSEIDAFPRAVLSHHYPEVPLHGDFTTIQAGDYAPIDLLVGGTPCQSFSVAGLRGGMADERGNLALEFLRLADRLRPRWVLWENVPGVRSSAEGRDFGAFLGGLAECGYGWAYRSLDAQFFGLAQRRERVFVVGYLGDWRPAAAVLFEPASLRGDPAPRREKGERVAPTVARGSPGGRTYGLDADTADSLIAGTLNANGKAAGSATQQDAESGLLVPQAFDILGTPATTGARATDLHTALRARAPGGSEASTTTVVAAFDGNNTAGPIDVATALNASHTASGRQDFETETFIAHALRAEGFDASEDGTGRGTPLVPTTVGTLTSNGDAHSGFKDEAGLIAVGATAETMYGVSHADAQEARPDQALRVLREAVGEKAFAEWGVGVVAALRASKVLQSGVHGGGIRCAPDNWKQLGDDALPCAEVGPIRAVQHLWRAGCDGCPPSGWQPSEQLARELGSYLSRLSRQGASPARLMLGLWRAGEGLGLLREALSAVQEAWRSASNQGEPAQPRAAVRRLTPREAERLQGFPDDYTLIPYRNGMAADGPRYKALGNSMAVPVLLWIGRRIMAAAGLQHPNQGNSDAG